MKLTEPIVYEIGYRTYQINERGMTSFYVLVGEDRGLVIDCGAGSFDARKTVERLCPLPYDVVLGHAHGDHCGACNQWERVYLHPGDMEVLQDNFRINQQLWENPNIWRTGANHKVRWPDGSLFEWDRMDQGAKELFDFSDVRFMGINPQKLPEIVPLCDGDIFALGGRKVRVLHFPGHTPGSCIFIDDGARIAFTSDSFYMNFSTGGKSVSATLGQLIRFYSYREEYDRIYYGHTSCAACLTNFSLPAQAVEDAIGLCRELLEGTQAYETVIKGSRPMGVASRGYITSFLFDPDHLW